MKFIGFSEWVVVRETQAPQQAPAAGKPSATGSEIKQVIASNIAKPKQVRSAALMALAKKKQADPKSTPKDLQDIADAMPGQDSGPQPK